MSMLCYCGCKECDGCQSCREDETPSPFRDDPAIPDRQIRPVSREELSQLKYLNREIEGEKRRLAELRNRINSRMGATLSPAEQEWLRAEIATAEKLIDSKILYAMAEYNRLNRYIASVDDSLIRQILAYRYINNFTWVQVAMHIGGGNTEEGVRKAHDRFLKAQGIG